MIGLIDIGGTKLLAATAAAGEPLRHPVRRATPTAGDVAGALGDMLEEARDGAPLEAIAMAVPGPFDRRRGRLAAPPGLAPAWHDLDLGGILGDRFGCPVGLENDANCAALAEARLGAGRGARLMVYFTVSTGIGTGVVRNGRLVIERDDQEGGHQVLWPAHLGGPRCECGGDGCLEAIASGRAIEARVGRPGAAIDDQRVWDEVGYWLGVAAVNAVALLDCDCVVFGGGVASARWRELEAALRASVGRHLHLQAAPHLRAAALGDDRNLWGALLVHQDSAGR